MKISFRKKKEVKYKPTFSLFSFKVIHRSIWAILLGVSFFISPWFLALLIPYTIFAVSSVYSWDLPSFLQWARTMSGKEDRHFTYRKLMYLMRVFSRGYKYDARYKANLADCFKEGHIYINKQIRIDLNSPGFFAKFTATIFYKNQEIDSVRGYSFQKLKFELSEFPDIMEEMQTFFIEREQMLKNKKNLTTQQQVKRKEELARLVKDDYNKM